MIDKKIVSENIRKIRIIKNFSRKKIADDLNMTIGNYGKIERGIVEVRLETLISISKIFDVSINELIQFDINKYISRVA
jgi:transcriptional regulator with XRE-family HTH domain